MMMMVMVTMMVNVCDDDCCLVMKVILVKEVMPCDVSPVAMFFAKLEIFTQLGWPPPPSVVTHVLACVVTHVLVLPFGASYFEPHFASMCSNTRASTCSNTRASTCYYACARLLFKNMLPGGLDTKIKRVGTGQPPKFMEFFKAIFWLFKVGIWSTPPWLGKKFCKKKLELPLGFLLFFHFFKTHSLINI